MDLTKAVERWYTVYIHKGIAKISCIILHDIRILMFFFATANTIKDHFRILERVLKTTRCNGSTIVRLWWAVGGTPLSSHRLRTWRGNELWEMSFSCNPRWWQLKDFWNFTPGNWGFRIQIGFNHQLDWGLEIQILMGNGRTPIDGKHYMGHPGFFLMNHWTFLKGWEMSLGSKLMGNWSFLTRFLLHLQVMARTAPAEEQLDMALRKLDACHRLGPPEGDPCDLTTSLNSTRWALDPLISRLITPLIGVIIPFPHL